VIDVNRARFLVTWYAGVHVDDVARVEGVAPEVLRLVRAHMGRGTEYGLRPREFLDRERRGHGPDQLTLAQCAAESRP